jgi:hypothetical protein
MKTQSAETSCVICGGWATRTIEPARRTLARGLDPGDPSYSVTVILPDIPLCSEHALEVDAGNRLIGYCDDQQCRTYGVLGEPSRCGELYKKLTPGNRA